LTDGGAPASLPPQRRPCARKLGGCIRAMPEVQARLVEQGAVPVGGDGAALAAVLNGELDRWTRLVREKGITP
jgi:tripartite-type tricarboxylate transporter receptor subunit TctC